MIINLKMINIVKWLLLLQYEQQNLVTLNFDTNNLSIKFLTRVFIIVYTCILLLCNYLWGRYATPSPGRSEHKHSSGPRDTFILML